MRGTPFVRLVLVVLAGAALLLARPVLKELGRRLRLAFLLILTVLAVSLLVRALRGEAVAWTAGAFAVVAPCLALAWRDYLRA